MPKSRIHSLEEWKLERTLEAWPLFNTEVWRQRFREVRERQHRLWIPVQLRLPFEEPGIGPHPVEKGSMATAATLLVGGCACLGLFVPPFVARYGPGALLPLAIPASFLFGLWIGSPIAAARRPVDYRPWTDNPQPSSISGCLRHPIPSSAESAPASATCEPARGGPRSDWPMKPELTALT